MKLNNLKNKKSEIPILDFGIFSIGIVSIFSYVAWLLTGIGVRNETSDKITFLSAMLGGIFAIYFALKFTIKQPVINFFATISWLSLLVGIFVVEHIKMSKEHPMGFGWQVGLLTFLVMPFFYLFLKHPNKYKKIELALWIPALFVLVCLILAFYQTPRTLLEVQHSEFIINEAWGFTVGNNSYQTFIPQYTFLLGLILKPFLLNFSAVAGTNFIVLFLTVLGYISIILMIFISKLAWPKLPIQIILLATIPFCTITPGWNRVSFIGPASTLLSGPPIRIFGGMIIGIITLFISKKLLTSKTPKTSLFALGALCAIVVWNNLDFGLAATLASFIVISFCGFISDYRNKLAFLIHIAGQVFGHGFILLMLSYLNLMPNWNYFGWFARQFAGGFGSVTIEMLGPVNLAFPLIIGSSVIGIYYLFSKSKNTIQLKTNQSDVNITAGITASYFGLFCTFALPYYVNRSYHSGQMSVLYIPLATALIAICSLFVNDGLNYKSTTLRKLFPSLIISFMIASSFLIPNPNIELNRLSGNNQITQYPRSSVTKAINQIPLAQQYAKETNKSISYYGESENYVKALTGLQTASIFNTPLDIFNSQNFVKLNCDFLNSNGTDLLVLSSDAENAFAWPDGSLCEGLYTKVLIPNIGILGVRR